MQTFLIKDALSFGWKTFRARPWLFVQAGLLLFLINLAVNLVQSAAETGATLGGDTVVLLVGIVSAIFGIAVSFLMSMGEVAFFLRAHDNLAATELKDLWHPQRFWTFVGAAILAAIAIILGLILFIVPGIILGVLFMFVGYLVIDKGANVKDALKGSWALTKGSRWKLFFLSLALIGINILGLLALIVGLFVSVPVSFLATVYAYRALSGTKASEPVAPAAVPEAVAV